VSWDDAQAFVAYLGGGARLPTEAEWEYAARSGGLDQTYPWGDELATCDRAVMNDGGAGCDEGHTWAVCSKPAGNSAQGVCDMAGNVFEWVQDDYHGSYNGAPGDGSAWVDEPRGSFRVFRGGSWLSPAGNLRAANRFGNTPSFRFEPLGFRPARSID
jgi:formylglycine-generating enzyme required for sulfatase activity